MGTEKPESYAETIAPCPHWGDKDITAEKVIRYALVSAQQEHEAMRLAMRADMKLERGSDEGAAAVQKTMIHTLNYIAQAVTADLMLTIKRLAPDEADGIATRFVEVGEAGDCWPEVIWEQMTERGIDPERIRTETIAAIAAEESK
ncbi:hypothetical protein C3B59_05695 [Cryobacterium zongtaii]|uniref:Uncharacterized protein n=1 Tax=Cryobacterium zongtaii TaxID=1259217 RepID=A0A2S3ZLJ1_9MICO|nr:hypothetical protein [Cryobacterium zongtaii]POH69382.1 hypothetical protein C3B59_05695 [Cryobacterium zongtaii]